MPTNRRALSRVTVCQLVELTGRSDERVRKVLRLEPALEPVERTAREVFYEARPALERILVGGEALDPTKERARLDAARADLAEQEHRKRSGELLDRAAVKNTWAGRVLTWKERLRSLPAVGMTRIPGFTREQSRALASLIDETLTEMADGKAATPRKRARRNGRAS